MTLSSPFEIWATMWLGPGMANRWTKASNAQSLSFLAVGRRSNGDVVQTLKPKRAHVKLQDVMDAGSDVRASPFIKIIYSLRKSHGAAS
jgi:hypothetical protein